MYQRTRECSSNKLGLVKLTILRVSGNFVWEVTLTLKGRSISLSLSLSHTLTHSLSVLWYLVIIVNFHSDQRRPPLDILLPAIYQESLHYQKLVPGGWEVLLDDLSGPAALSNEDLCKWVGETRVVKSQQGSGLVDVTAKLKILKIQKFPYKNEYFKGRSSFKHASVDKT